MRVGYHKKKECGRSTSCGEQVVDAWQLHTEQGQLSTGASDAGSDGSGELTSERDQVTPKKQYIALSHPNPIANVNT